MKHTQPVMPDSTRHPDANAHNTDLDIADNIPPKKRILNAASAISGFHNSTFPQCPYKWPLFVFNRRNLCNIVIPAKAGTVDYKNDKQTQFQNQKDSHK